MLEKTCANCGKIFLVKQSHFDRRLTCCKSCYYQYRSKQNSVNAVCQHCGKTFTVAKSRESFGRGKFCSLECKHKRQKNLRFGDRETRVCRCCGGEFDFLLCKTTNKVGAGSYCSEECFRQHRRGENHPMYISGSASYRRGSNWQSQKRKAKQRDNFVCQQCGKSDVSDLHVHHIKPYRLFDSFLDANQLENLITLCSSCHRKEDASFRKLEK